MKAWSQNVWLIYYTIGGEIWDDSRRVYKKEGTKDLSFKEELHEEIYDPKVVEPTSCIDVNKDLIWLTSSFPTLKALFEPQQPCAWKMSHVGSTCQTLYYHAKLEGNQDSRTMGSVVWQLLWEEAALWWARHAPTLLHQKDVALSDGESTLHPLWLAVPIQGVFLSHLFLLRLETM